MKELYSAVLALNESQARVLGAIFAQMDGAADYLELVEFRKTIAACLFEQEARIQDPDAGPMPAETLDNIAWPTSQAACQREMTLYRGMQRSATEREQLEVAQIWGQLSAQLAISGDQARREGRELRSMTSGYRWRLSWEGE